MREDWIEVELGEAFNITYGKGLSTKDLLKEGYPVYGANGVIGFYSDYKYEERQVLISCRGAASGKINISPEKCFITNNSLIVESSSDFISKEYLYFILSGANRSKIVTGSAQPQVTINNANPLIIKLAPLSIQRAIVSKIEALFSDLDNGLANFRKAQEQFKIYRQAVLKKAFEGELTKEWREKRALSGVEVPIAEELLKQIKEERQNHYNQQIEAWKKAVKEWEKNGKVDDKPRKPSLPKDFPPLKDDELNKLPKSWKWVNWNDILDYNEGAFKRGPFGSSLTKSIFVESGYKVYEQYCPINDDCSFERYYITAEKFKELNSYSVKQGDNLISCSGVTLGRITQVPEKFKEGVINQALLRLRINKDFIDDKFFKFYFRSPFFQKQIFDNSTGSAIPNIKGVNELKIIPVPLLTKAEQTQIVQEIESRLSVCDKMEQSISESLEKAEALRQSILKKAFEGKLLSQAEVEQCKQAADYEPASELLKKIKAEKLAKEQEKKKSTTKKKSKE